MSSTVANDYLRSSVSHFTINSFLPEVQPIQKLPDEFKEWNHLVTELPDLLAAKKFNSVIKKQDVKDVSSLISKGEQELALLMLSVFAHASIHENWKNETRSSICPAIAVPLAEIADTLNRKPVLSYYSHGLNNWKKLDSNGDVEINNLAIICRFYGGLDESWFIRTHIDIEKKAEVLVKAANTLMNLDGYYLDSSEVVRELNVVSRTLHDIKNVLANVRSNCDPDIFFNRIQPFMRGMNRVRFEGVAKFNNQPISHPGGSGAQSLILPLIDALLGIQHAEDELLSYLIHLRAYMPIEHQNFLSALLSKNQLRSLVLTSDDKTIIDSYNNCIYELAEFRSEHLKITVDYIHKPASKYSQSRERGEIGTGGSPFMKYLKKHREETLNHLIT